MGMAKWGVERQSPNMQYVQIPVPEHLVPDVMALIVARTEATAATPAPSVGSASFLTASEVPKAWEASAMPMRKVLAYIAARPGKNVAGDELAKVLGKTDRGHSIAGMMGAFGKRMKNRHGGRWPFEAKWNAVDARWEYCMPASIAAVISKLAVP